MNYKTLLIATTTATLLMSGCDADRGTTLQDSLVGNTVEDKIAGYAVFDPTEGIIPYPNNILFAANSSENNDSDGYQTLNIPYNDDDADALIKKQLNELTGFSTISPITAPITASLDIATMTKDSVQLYPVEMHPSIPVVIAVGDQLVYGEDYAAVPSDGNIVIMPLQPLEKDQNYMVVLTNGLKDSSNRILTPDIATALILGDNPITASSSLDPATAASLEQLRQANQAMYAALGISADHSHVVQMWNFRTQKIGHMQEELAAYPLDANLTLTFTDMNTTQFNPALQGLAKIYVGTLNNVPQFMPQASNDAQDNAFFGNISLHNGTPVVEANTSLPVIVTVPNFPGCTAPYPVVIYQHGITRVRTDLLAYADTFGSKCFAAIAIDLPLHGITDETSLLYTGPIERTFNIDKDGDDVIDSSGTHYINLEHISTTRDNMHQTTSDLLQLQHALSTFSDFNTSNIHFVAHSLGAIAANGYVNNSSSLNSITLAMPGQGVAQLLNNSVDFGPVIEAGLRDKGIEKDTAAYESFMIASQTIVDDADPANMELRSDLKVLAFEIIGSDGFPSDTVIPNSVATAPLSGTDPFLRQMGALDINATDNTFIFFDSNKTVTRLLRGNHSSPLRPDDLEVTIEIQTQIMSFILSNGLGVQVTNKDLIK